MQASTVEDLRNKRKENTSPKQCGPTKLTSFVYKKRTITSMPKRSMEDTPSFSLAVFLIKTDKKANKKGIKEKDLPLKARPKAKSLWEVKKAKTKDKTPKERERKEKPAHTAWAMNSTESVWHLALEH